MSRVIKFRAWHTAHQVMYEPKSIGVLLKNVADDNIWKFMQFTGLKDKNGKDIYEGDIIEMGTYRYDVHFEDAKFVCYHLNEGWGKWGNLHRFFDPDYSKYDWQVIGNIYENPELKIKTNEQ